MGVLHLHPDPLRTLVPLLKAQLPNSLPALGAITYQSSLHSSFAAWATFPPSSSASSQPPELWVVLVPLQPPSTRQARLYCSHERDASFDGTSEAEELVLACVRELNTRDNLWAKEDVVMVGALHSMWMGCLGGAVDGLGREVEMYTVYLAPERDEVTAQGAELATIDGLELRAGQPADVDLIISTSKIPRFVPYITSLLPISSVATLPSPSDPSVREPAAWILSHSDSALGTLFVMPDHRRKGLAKQVVHHRLAQPGASRGFVFVEKGNEASEGLWETLGWEKGWETVWYRYKS